jgi:putative transposase
MQGIKRRQRLGIDVWRKVFDRFERANMTVGEFCKREGLCVSSFHRWRPRVEQVSAARDVAVVAKPGAVMATGFVDLGSIGRAEPAHRLDVRLDLGGGVTLHIVRA